MINDKTQIEGAQVIRQTDLDRFMAELETNRAEARHLMEERRTAQEAIRTHKRSVLLAAQDRLASEEARLQIETAGQGSNDTARKAALTAAKTKDPDYLAALKELRNAEDRLEDLQASLQQAEDEIKAHQDYCWNLRELISGARAEIMAIATFDAPKLPSEIPLTITGNLPASIPLVVQGSLPSEIPLTITGADALPTEIALKAPESLPEINVTYAGGKAA